MIISFRQPRAEADPSVIDLTRILLDDFDSRYQPSSSGKVTYFPEDVVGRMNRYLGLHQYFFFSSFLDPRILPMLSVIIVCCGFDSDSSQLTK